MAKTYSRKSQLENLGELNPNASGSPTERGDTGLPPEAVALLNTISGTESTGSYNVIYRGDHFKSYDAHPKVWVNIPGTNKFSSAAGKYQFIAPTWNAAQKALGLKDFSPASQDKAAWWLAQRQYKSDTGRDLLTDLRSGGTKNMARITTSLSKQWESLPSGGRPLVTASAFADRYNAHLSKAADHPVPPVGIGVNDNGDVFNPLPAPAPLTPRSSGIGASPVSSTRSIGLGARQPGNVAAVGTKAAGATYRPPPIDVPTTRETVAERVQAQKVRPVPVAAPAPRVLGLGTQLVPSWNRTAEQVARDEQNAIRSGYRAVQEGYFPAAPNAPKPFVPPPVSQPAVRPGVQKVVTVTQRPDGTTRSTDVAGSSEMPVARPSSLPQGGLIQGPASPSDVPKYITVTEKVARKVAGGAAPDVARSTLDDIHDAREAAQMKAQVSKVTYDTITKQKLNPEWVKQQQAPRPVVAPRPAPAPRVIGLGTMAPAIAARANPQPAPTPGTPFLQAQGLNTSGMTAGQIGNALNDSVRGAGPGQWH